MTTLARDRGQPERLANLDAADAAASPATPSVRWKILLYLGALIVLLGFGAPGGGLIGLPISFILKNKLHLKAHQTALFGLVAATPIYFSTLFGLARDRWSPFGMGDRGFLLLFGAICAVVYVLFAFVPLTYVALLVAVALARIAYLFVLSAQSGLTSAIGQQHVMSGQISAAWNLFSSLPGIAALLLGGAFSDLLEGERADQAAHNLFFVGAAIMALIALLALCRPASVFQNLRDERLRHARLADDLRRLIRHWPIYPALLIWMLWNFAPGSVTALQYYLQDTLHAKDAQRGQWNAVFAVGFIPTYMLFGLLCQKLPLRTLLIWGTVVAVPQMVPLLFIHSVAGALVAAAAIGLMGGVATSAYMALLIRSCPQGLQGTVMMAALGLFEVSTRLGDVLGTDLYDAFGGFTVCVIAITAVYALILPLVFLAPRSVVDMPDGEAPKPLPR
ncbi:MAG TPA: MFS transporter [Caulobacteraceae bacterium]|nr:MFS transporter [Caulobacteraceae bacterium]